MKQTVTISAAQSKNGVNSFLQTQVLLTCQCNRQFTKAKLELLSLAWLGLTDEVSQESYIIR